jgi:hypothetical protein
MKFFDPESVLNVHRLKAMGLDNTTIGRMIGLPYKRPGHYIAKIVRGYCWSEYCPPIHRHGRSRKYNSKMSV